MKSSKIKPLLTGLIYSILATVFFVLVLAIFIVLGMGGMASDIFIQIAKVLSIFFGVGMALKSVNKLGWVYGLATGVVYSLLAFLIFSVVDVNFGIGVGILAEMLFAGVVGVLSALLLRGFNSKLNS